MNLNQLGAFLRERREQHLYRQRKVIAGPQGPVVYVDDRPLISFCSNDYLGLANHPKAIEALRLGAERYGVGSGASHLISGHSEAHHDLELELAEFVRRPRALLFSTGFMANLGVITALFGKGDAIFEDRLNHASLIDAGLYSGARVQRYLHADANSLQNYLAKSPAEQKLIVSDGVFSMDGDIAPLPNLAKLAAEHNTWLMVDDAHGFGVLGESGRGSAEHFGLDNGIPIYMATLGKALGTFGAFVAGSEALIETLIQLARSYTYTTALPPAVAEATRANLRLVQQEPWRRDKLRSLITRFRQGAQQLGLTLMDSVTPIQPLLVGDSETALRYSDALLEKGFLISAVRPPTVPQGSARLRITFSASHDEAQIDQLLDALDQIQ
ncbi:MAG: 8-amino-7-oxononanoate synthase [Gammaproteobacteria bacterium]